MTHDNPTPMAEQLMPRGRTFTMPGDRPEQRWLCVHRIEDYNYRDAPTTCPLCGGVALPWAGWVHCDGSQHCLAVTRIATGEILLPVGFRSPEETTDG